MTYYDPQDFALDFVELLSVVVEADEDFVDTHGAYHALDPTPDLYAERADGVVIPIVIAGTEGGIAPALAKLARIRKLMGSNVPGVVACPWAMSDRLRVTVPRDVLVWDAAWFFVRHWHRLATPVHHLSMNSPIQVLHASVGRWLRQRLKALPTGNADGEAKRFEDLVRDIVEFLYFPELCFLRAQVPSDAGDRRLDLLFRNDATSGPWHTAARATQNNPYVTVEVKNRVGVGNDDIVEFAKHLKGDSFSRLGIFVFRGSTQRRAVAPALMRLRASGSAVVLLNGQHLNALLDFRSIYAYGRFNANTEFHVSSAFAG